MGQSDGSALVPMVEGIPGGVMSTSSLSAASLKNGIQEAMTVRCPRSVTKPSGSGFLQDFESNTQRSSGTKSNEMEPFCGMYTSKNPSSIFYANKDNDNDWIKESGVKATYSYFCFAYSGKLEDSIYVKWMYTNAVTNAQETRDGYISVVLADVVDAWSYKCLDLYTSLILSSTPTSIAAKSDIYILEVKIFNSGVSGVEHIYVDTISFTNGPMSVTTAEVLHYLRAKPSRWMLDSVSVASLDSTETEQNFEVTIDTVNCVYNVGLLSFQGASVVSGSLSASSATATLKAPEWSSLTQVVVTRLQAASPPVTGNVYLSYGGVNVQGFPADSEAATVKSILEQTSSDMGTLEVKRTGECDGYTWEVGWKTSPWDHPPLTVVNANSLNGLDAHLEVKLIQDGGMNMEPIHGELLRTSHDHTQK
jgi:hypothetical protein